MLPILREYYPEGLEDGTINRYMEPCVGAGAVLFDLLSHYDLVEVTINDINKVLITCYRVMQRNVSRLISILEEWQRVYNLMAPEQQEQMYYEKRDRMNHRKRKEIWGKEDELIIAAHMLFLNRTCFNGLYRENRKGDFNVPVGSYKNPQICNKENLLAVSKKLKNVKIVCGDYKESADFIDDKTFVYFDPPYRPLTPTANFTSYTEELFDDKNQLELARFVQELDNKGAKIVVSNSDPKNTNKDDDFFDKAYSKQNIKRVSATRMINRNSDARGKISELLISNFNN